jgi:ribosomal protein L7/L12
MTEMKQQSDECERNPHKLDTKTIYQNKEYEMKLKLHDIDLGRNLLRSACEIKNEDQKKGSLKQAIDVAVKGYGETHREKVKSYYENLAGVRLTKKALLVGGWGIILIVVILTVVMSSLPRPRTLSDAVGHGVISVLVMGIGLMVLSVIFRLTNKFQSRVEAERASQELDKVENEIRSKLLALTRQKYTDGETTFNVVLKEPGNKKIQVVKDVIALTGLGLKQAVGIVENAPKIVKQDLTKEEADTAKKRLESSGAVVEICALTGQKEEGYNRACSVLIGDICKGKVIETKEFGVFVQLPEGREGLCHISELDTGYVKKVEDVCKVDDVISVKVLSIDESGRIKLSRKAALAELERKRNQ